MFRFPGRSLLLLRVTRLPCVGPSRGRKSRTDPPAKSKASRIKYPPPVCVEELLNVSRRYREYSAILTAIRAECKEGVLRSQYEEQVGSLAEQRHRLESEEHRTLMIWNDEENRMALRRREERQRLEQEVLQRQEKISTEQNHIEEQQFIREKEWEIEVLQEMSKSFITAENLSEKIEAALDNPISYNFYLDKEGRIVREAGARM